MEKIIIGQWYKVKRYNYYAKCVDYIDSVMYANEFYMSDQYYTYKNYDFCKGYDWEKATLEEIQQYLPEGHPDKFIPMKTLPEEYIVECDKKSYEANEVLCKYYTYDTTGHRWKYIICTNALNKKGYPDGPAVEDWIKPQYSSMPVFTYNEWKELFYKQEEKKEEFVLPEKWCVYCDRNSKEINDFYNKQANTQCYDNLKETYYHSHNAASGDSIFSTHPGSNFTGIIKRTGYTEITFEQFKKYVLKQETMKAQLFTITGSPALLKAMWEELTALGYYQNSKSYTAERKGAACITNNLSSFIDDITKYKEICCVDFVKKNKISFNLPLQYNEALAFAKAQLNPALWEEPEVKLPFADLTFTVNKSKGTATCEHGTITKAEIKAVIEAIISPKVKLLGYNLGVAHTGTKFLTFGCQTGTLVEAKAILKAFN